MPREFSTRVAGVYYYRGDVQGLLVGQILRLTREPNNPHDRNAVAVYTPDSRQLGHIPRGFTPKLASEMDSGLSAYGVIQWIRERYDPPRKGRRRGAGWDIRRPRNAILT
jgi:hypothetical protein